MLLLPGHGYVGRGECSFDIEKAGFLGQAFYDASDMASSSTIAQFNLTTISKRLAAGKMIRAGVTAGAVA